MVNPISAIEAGGAALAETSIGKALLDKSASLASSVWESDAGRAPSEIAGSSIQSPQWLAELLTDYHGGIPATYSKITVSASDAEIGSVMTPERSRSLGLALHVDSKDWSEFDRIQFTATEEGKQLLPAVEINTSSLRDRVRGSWTNGKVKLGEDAFFTPFNPEKAGTAVHEITHHEQGFLILSRQADLMGIRTGQVSDEQVQRLLERMSEKSKGMLKPKTAERFLAFRDGRTLTADAADRADQLADSFKTLWHRPEEQWGANIKHRVSFINNMLNSAEGSVTSFESVVGQLQNKETGLEFMKKAFGPIDGEHEYEDLMKYISPKPVSSWSVMAVENTRGHIVEALEDAHTDALATERVWNRAYHNALHEQEARFNGYIAKESLRDQLDALVTKETLHPFSSEITNRSVHESFSGI